MAAIIEMENKFNVSEVLNKIPETEPCLRWAKMYFSENKNYVALYESGKVLISGVKSDEELNIIANNLVEYLKSYGISNSIRNIKVNNYVLADQIGHNIDLNHLIVELFEYDASYEPEQFPALKFKDQYGITYLLFNSGKITITGVKSLENIDTYVNEFKDLIHEKSNVKY